MTSRIYEYIYNLWYLLPESITNQGYNYVQPIYGWLSSFYDGINTIYHKCPLKNDKIFIRCTHNNEFDNDFTSVIEKHDEHISEFYSNSRFTIGSNNNPFDLDKIKIVIDVPIVFHLVDTKLQSKDLSYWTQHINNNIINQLNKDFNVSLSNFGSEYISNVNSLFKNADPIKKNFYLNSVSTLPDNPNIQWIFSLAKIVFNPIAGLNIDNNSNNEIFQNVTLEDPENYLNIVIVPSSQILGISIFPFSDRSSLDKSKISQDFKFRHGILINTDVFTGTTVQFDKYRTFTHEIGHWCGLLHPFDNTTYKTEDITKFGLNNLDFDKTPNKPGSIDQDFVGDLIADTSTQNQPTYGTVYDKVTFITKKINGKIQNIKIRNTPYSYIFENNNQTPNFYNFMDYTDDRQMCMFTHLQILHMVYLLMKFRPNFLKQE